MTTLATKTAALLFLMTLAALASGCRQTATSREDPPRRADARPRPAAPTLRTVLIQLDGFGADWLERYLKERRFLPNQPPAPASQVAAGGLARLAAGARARALVPVEPTLTAPCMVSMLTGVSPARHGVISNRFFRRGQRVNGFTEPLAS
ncbi:MAG: alkaline phosphatase family protein, partial [bacterium]